MSQAYIIVHDQLSECRHYIDTFLAQNKIHQIDQLDLTENESIGIQDVRKLISFLQLKPFTSTHKAGLLTAELLSLEAQQSLLKITEEPPPNSFIFISAQSEEQLLPTILSRSTIIRLEINRHIQTTSTTHAEFWTKLLRMHPIRRISLTPDFTDNRPNSILWLNEQIVFLRNALKSKYTPGPLLKIPIPELISLIKTIQTALIHTKANVSLKLTFDHLFLETPWIKTA